MSPKNKSVIILVGMMGSGKSTVGKLLAKLLDYQFIDTDNLIIEKENESINDIFNNKGESYFRNLKVRYYMILIYLIVLLLQEVDYLSIIKI